MSNPIPANDAAGGAGSIIPALRNIAINGVSRAADGYLSRKFPLTSFNETETINAVGERKPSSAPQKNVSATEAARGVVLDPTIIAIGVAVAISLAFFVAMRK